VPVDAAAVGHQDQVSESELTHPNDKGPDHRREAVAQERPGGVPDRPVLQAGRRFVAKANHHRCWQLEHSCW
jgi:hypothetical protein